MRKGRQGHTLYETIRRSAWGLVVGNGVPSIIPGRTQMKSTRNKLEGKVAGRQDARIHVSSSPQDPIQSTLPI